MKMSETEEKDPMPSLTESSDDDGKSDNEGEKDNGDESEEIYDSSEDGQSIQEEEKDPEALKEEGRRFFHSGNYNEAIQKYKDALKTGEFTTEDEAKCLR